MDGLLQRWICRLGAVGLDAVCSIVNVGAAVLGYKIVQQG